MSEYYVVEPCTTSAGFEIKLQNKKIDLKKAEEAFSKIGEVIAAGPVVLLVKVGEYAISVYKSGRMMVKSENKLESAKVSELAEKIVTRLEEAGSI